MRIEDIRLIRKTMRQLQRNLGWQWKNDAACCGITVAQCHALLEVAERGELSLAELAEAIGLDRSTLSRTVDGVVEEGLLERRANPGDRRYVSITLTDRGRAVCEEFNSTFDHFFNGVFELIAPEKKQQVLESLVLLTEAVRQAAGPNAVIVNKSKRRPANEQ